MESFQDDLISLHKSSKFHGRKNNKGEREDDEEMEWMVQQHEDSRISIPNSLPIKMKELLIELSMVEKEITRLECQISSLQHVHVDSNPTNHNVPFEIKALHFITRAITGDDHYNLTHFTTTPTNHNASRDYKRTTFRDKLFRQRHPVIEKRKRNTPPTNASPKVLLMSTPLHNQEERWKPNKLSENIMKCLILIYTRLLRTSNATEVEKSGAITGRSTNFSFNFRGDQTNYSTCKSRINYQKDPYGIFESKDSMQRDIGSYKNLVRFTSRSMDFNCIKNSGFLPLFQKLKIFMDELQKLEMRLLNHKQKLAFWINMYNACIMHGYLQFGLPSVSSPEKMLALINQATLNIGGNTINAATIEHFILRPVSVDKLQICYTKEMAIHQLYGLQIPDPNIVFALCCGTRSSPAVKIYTADGVTSELEKSKLEYLQAAIIVKNSKVIALPELLLNNMPDFEQDMCSLLEWLCHQLPPCGSLRKSIVDCFRKFVQGDKISTVVEMIPYEYEFQYLFVV